MKALLKSLILYPSDKKYTTFKDVYYAMLQKRDKYYDDLVNFIIDARNTFGIYFPFSAIKKELVETQETNLLSYVVSLEEDVSILLVPEDAEYIVYSKSVEKLLFEAEVFSSISKFQQEIKITPKKDILSIAAPVEQLLSSLHASKNKVLRTEASTAGLLFGDDSITHVQDIYAGIVEKKKEDDFLYFTFGFKKFEEVKITKGDLVVIGGFTSHGKSLLLRNFVYRLLVEYGLNCYYCSLEMSYEKMKLLFLVLHANNKTIFPGTPDIKYSKIKEGELTDEEYHFVFETVATDFFKKGNYGTLYLEYPNKSRFRLSDIKNKVNELESTSIPVHAVAIDYLTMLYPLESDKGTPDRQDYNQMVKEFKNMALSHKRLDGNSSPFIALTPAQISRGGLETAMNNNNYYDLSSLREYSELESSADIVMTTMLTPDMRDRECLSIQNLKNRDGKVETEPVEIKCALSKGFNLFEHEERPETMELDTIRNLEKKGF